jgi:protein-S-isoprenylcysteine O-methyltransferase Ste14
MNNTTIATANGASAGSGLAIIVVNQIASHYGWSLTPDAAVGAAFILASVVHYCVLWLPKPPEPKHEEAPKA